MELLATFLTIGFVAVVAPFAVEALKKAIEKFSWETHVHPYYPVVNLVMALYLAFAVQAVLANAFGVDWYFAGWQQWAFTGLIASLGSNGLYRLTKKLIEVVNFYQTNKSTPEPSLEELLGD